MKPCVSSSGCEPRPDLPGFFGPLLTREWRPLDSFLTSRRLSVSAS